MKKYRQKYWAARIEKMFLTIEGSDLVENRYNALRYLLVDKYPQLKEISKETCLEMLREIIYVDRAMRRATEGKQEKEKKILSQEYQVEELGYGAPIKV